MVFQFSISEDLKEIMKKLQSKDKQLLLELNKKIKQIIDCDKETIRHYKNLRYGLSDYKRTHIGKSFVLAFSVDIQNNRIIFDRLEHHDKAYKR
jgi:YafQ family addiction module toxin component